MFADCVAGWKSRRQTKHLLGSRCLLDCKRPHEYSRGIGDTVIILSGAFCFDKLLLAVGNVDKMNLFKIPAVLSHWSRRAELNGTMLTKPIFSISFYSFFFKELIGFSSIAKKKKKGFSFDFAKCILPRRCNKTTINKHHLLATLLSMHLLEAATSIYKPLKKKKKLFAEPKKCLNLQKCNKGQFLQQ